MPEKIEARLRHLEAIATRYDDVIGREAEELRREYQLVGAEQLTGQLRKLEDDFRLLHIGIIGKVKAGKSSLLNAVFFDGENVLPKAATPMTASLTQLTWGDSCQAHVDYFTPTDIQAIAAAHDKYERRFLQAYETALQELKSQKRPSPLSREDLERRAHRRAEQAIPDEALKSAYDQYRRMRATGKFDEFMTGKTASKLNAGDRGQLMRELGQYVGSKGPLMPFTRSVKLCLPEPGLKDIVVVDTPGLNDPVVSRSQRTSEYLSECDVVFIVSPAGQFVSLEDTGLMDRLSSRQGVREIYLVASQADNQLFGDIGARANWNLDKAVQDIRTQLAAHARQVLSDIREHSPETSGQFDQLLEPGSSRIIVTSSVCHALARHYDQMERWDSSMQHVHGLLQKNFRDYFDGREAALANLAKLNGVEHIAAAITDARQKKDAILGQRKTNLLTAQKKAVTAYADELRASVRTKAEKLERTDLADIQNEKKKLESVRRNATATVDDAFEESLDNFRQQLRDAIAAKRHILFAEARADLDKAERSETRTRYWTTGWWLWKKTHSSDYTVTTVRAGAVKNQLNSLRNDLQESLLTAVETCKVEWKKDVQRIVTRALREAVEDEDSVDFAVVKTALRRQVGSMEIPDLDFSSCTFDSSASGKLESSEAEQFISEAQDYIARLRSYFQQQTASFITQVENSVRKFSMSGMLFGDINSQIEQLEKDLQNRQGNLERLRQCLKELEG